MSDLKVNSTIFVKDFFKNDGKALYLNLHYQLDVKLEGIKE